MISYVFCVHAIHKAHLLLQHDLPNRVHSTIQVYSRQLYEQLSDYTPSLSQIERSLESIPIINTVTHKDTPEPPPEQLSFMKSIVARADGLTGSRRRTSIVAGVAVVGLSLAIASRNTWMPSYFSQSNVRTARLRNGVRCDAVVVLGADTAVGQALSHHLAAQGYIVLAGVADDESKQTFDAFIPPSSRGYIKSIVLQSQSPKPEDITFFVRSVAAAKELRWPLTAAGDPYARPGAEIDIVAVINALTYRSSSEIHAAKSLSSSSSSMTSSSTTASLELEPITKEVNERVIVPLTTIKALLPILSHPARSAPADGPSSRSKWPPSLIISVANPASHADVSTQALLAGMQKLRDDLHQDDKIQGDHRSHESASRRHVASFRRPLALTTLQIQQSTVVSLIRSVLPSYIGGAVPTISRPVLPRRTSAASSDSLTQSTRKSLDSSGKITERTPRKSSIAEARAQRSVEVRAILEATSAVMERSLDVSRVRATYVVRLPASALVREQPAASRLDQGLEPTCLLRLLTRLCAPLVSASRALASFCADPYDLWRRGPGAAYRGTRNVSNNQPAYGPGPGPASNTHSRSCIRENTPADASQTSKRRARPASTASTSSSEAARSSESEGANSASGPRSSSNPASNQDMSSSGLLSSVPSSAFGDASEEEHMLDSDFVGSTDSPVLESDWHHRRRHSSNVGSEHDSDTALGARNYSDVSGETPSASQVTETQYGFPSQASMQSTEEAPWMGPPSRGSDSPRERQTSSHLRMSSVHNSTTGSETPLGHSWVALGQSSLQQSDGEAKPS